MRMELPMPNRSISPKFICWLLLLPAWLVLHTWQPSPAAERVSIQQILANPDAYDGQEVLLEGRATRIQLRVSQRGNEYATFRLVDASGKGIKVFAWGHPNIEEGQKVTVRGTYQKVRRVGRYTFYDEVEAQEIR
jgi:hypothetical protein